MYHVGYWDWGWLRIASFKMPSVYSSLAIRFFVTGKKNQTNNKTRDSPNITHTRTTSHTFFERSSDLAQNLYVYFRPWDIILGCAAHEPKMMSFSSTCVCCKVSLLVVQRTVRNGSNCWTERRTIKCFLVFLLIRFQSITRILSPYAWKIWYKKSNIRVLYWCNHFEAPVVPHTLTHKTPATITERIYIILY